MSSLFVISAVAKDQPGLAHRVAQVLADINVNIVDIDARSVRGHFSMFLVVDLKTSTFSCEEMMSRMAALESRFELGLRVEPYEAGRRNPVKKMMVLTVMGRDRPGIVAAVSGVCARNKVNIESIRMIARGDYIAMELSLDGSALTDVAALRREFYTFSEKSALDVSLRDEDLFNKPRRVVVFDCDSTLIQEEIIDEMAEIAGVGARVKAVTARAMNGEIDFIEAITERIRLLKGLTRHQLESIFDSVHLTPGAEDLIATLRFMGYKVAVVSGGFSFFTDYLKDRLNLDYVFANELEIKDGVVTGEIRGRIIDAQSKADILNEIAEKENISPDQIVAVGDGANDRFMLQNAGLAIAFNPKEALKKYSDGMLSNDNLSGLLYFLGIPDAQMEKIQNGGV